MPSYKDSQRGTWYCKFSYTDWTGTRKQKLKRGFQLKRDADAFEQDYIRKMSGSPDMTFAALADLYLEDVKINSKAITYKTRESRLRVWIRPYFDKMAVNEITPAQIRQWENMLKDATGSTGKPLSLDYMDNLVVQLSGVFQYAVRFHGLQSNPVRIAGNSVGKKTHSLNFWTKEQFDKFITSFSAEDPFHCLFDTLYYTGVRIGELQALTSADIDLDAGIMTVNKTYHMIQGKALVTPPKTTKANRTVTLPAFLCDEIRRYQGLIYGLRTSDRLFFQSSTNIEKVFKDHVRAAGLPRIRLHDIRHSHASLLIELGFSALLVSERLGHENVSTTLNIYAHLFPSKQSEVADKLQQLFSGSIKSVS